MWRPRWIASDRLVPKSLATYTGAPKEIRKMTGEDNKKRVHEVFKRLNKLNRSQIVFAAREFRLAGLRADAGSCYFHAGQRDFRNIELVVSSTTERSNYLLTIS